MDNTELQNIIAQQSQMITQLTITVSNFISNQVAMGQNGMVQYHNDNIKGGRANNGLFAENSKFSKEEIESMRKEEDLGKNERIRIDGRYEWEKMIGGRIFRAIDRNWNKFREKVREQKNLIKQAVISEVTLKKEIKAKDKNIVYDLALKWYDLYKKDKIKSHKRYKEVIENHIKPLNQNIASYKKNDIQKFLNNIDGHRSRAYVYDTLKGIFAEAKEDKLIKENVMLTLKAPKRTGETGTWIDLDGQKKILDKILPLDHKEKIGEEVLFYLMTGARCEEALETTINFEKRVAKIRNMKAERDATPVYKYVELSQSYCDRIKEKWNLMFRHTAHYYSKEISKFIKSLKIGDKSLHSLRHTFSTNLYYLKTDDKSCQMAMGHASISMTRDVYTTYDPTIIADDIINLYGDLYPYGEGEKLQPSYQKKLTENLTENLTEKNLK